MGNKNSGRKRSSVCSEGHSLEDGDPNVRIIRRAGGKTERACRECARRRSREWWAKHRARETMDR